MVRYHYALVDDLISREEFDRRIEEKISACGNLADDVAAALLVVRDLDRAHVKIRGLRGKSSLFCFYGKVIACSGAKEFDRPDGNKGLVARLTVADETGQTDLVFWDEQAGAISETFAIGEVVEIIGRHGKNLKEIMPLNLRQTHVEIDCAMNPKEQKQPERKEALLMIVSLQPPRPFTRRDGTAGEMISGVVGDNTGTARLLCWDAVALTGITSGMSVLATDLLEKEGDFGGREMVIDENTTLTPAQEPPIIPLTPFNDIKPEQTISVSGTVVRAPSARLFTRRDGIPSWVRNIQVSDGTCTLALVIWDEEAKRPLLPGERFTAYHVQAKIGRTGEIELSIGRGSCLLLIPDESGERICIDGTILDLPEGTIIDDGRSAWLVTTDLPHGADCEICGIASGRRLFRERDQPSGISLAVVKERLSAFVQSLS
ncbi:MAG TPA: nucleic acid-binding protein [Methanospirillum sp.]|nr:nucleic acid-binding protein [Methanospirillum sp.]